MISGTGHRPTSNRGFTLLEICICLAIIVVLMGAAVPNIAGWLREQRLREPARHLAELARKARLAAIQHQQVYQITIRPDQMFLEAVRPPLTASEDNPVDPTGNLSSPPELPTNPEEDTLPDPYLINDSTTLLVQGWNDRAMHAPTAYLWTFAPNGLCDPLSIKFVQGKAELEMDFDPLTATVAEEKYYVP